MPMKMASRSIDLISKKQKTFGRAARFFVFLCRCFARLQCHFVRLRRQTSYLHVIFWRNCRMYLPKILFPVSCSLLFFHCRPFSPGRQHFSFSHRCYEIFMFFYQRNSSTLFSITGSSSFSVTHVSVEIKNNIKINVEKDTTLFFFSLSLKVRAAMPVD